MTRLYLFAEGQTEQTFADTVLRPHLATHGVFLHSPVLVAHARRKGIVHRGGGRKYLPMANDIRRFLAQEKVADVYFTTMIDLYAIPADFPRLDEADRLPQPPYSRVAFLEKAFAQDIGDRRFMPYIQLHEFEAYLFSAPEWFEYFYDRHEEEIGTLVSVANTYGNPELIDEGRQTAPSKRIIQQFPDYADAKTAIGPQVAELIGLAQIRARCPHFNDWLSQLEGLESGSGGWTDPLAQT